MGDDGRPGWAYYGAIALFVGILGFAVLGLLRSSSLVGSAPTGSASRELAPTKGPAHSVLAVGPPPTIRIPPPTASAATPPPSRTYIHPPPEAEAVYSDPAAEIRR
ncbi:MAG: hypothetical protein ABI610_08215 [Acidobacteriota bacterium]